MVRLRNQLTYQTFWGTTTPPNTAAATVTWTNFGVAYKFLVAGRVLGMRYAREKRSSGSVVGQIFNGTTGVLDRVCMFRNKSVGTAGFDRWEHAYFRPWYPVAAGASLFAAVWFASCRMVQTNGGLTAADVTHGNIVALRDLGGTGFYNGATSLDCGAVPQSSAAGALYGIDVLFLPN